MTEKELIIRVANQLGNEAETNPWLRKEGAIKLAISYALQELADNVSRNPETRHLLQHSYAVTVTSGEADLYDVADVPDLATYTPILTDSLCYGSLTDSEGNIYTFLPSHQDFLLPQPTVLGYYALAGQRLKVKEISSGATDASGAFTLVASFVPTVAQVKSQLDNDLVNATCVVVKRDFTNAAN